MVPFDSPLRADPDFRKCWRSVKDSYQPPIKARTAARMISRLARLIYKKGYALACETILSETRVKYKKEYRALFDCYFNQTKKAKS